MRFQRWPMFLAAAVAFPAKAQTPIKLKPANGTLSAEFTGLTSIREIADGRVIITDGRDQSLWIADFTADRCETLGRKGRGPGEYSFVGFVHALGGDSSIMADLGRRRWLLFDGARIVGTVPPDDPAIVRTEGLLLGADGLGHVMRTRSRPYAPGVTETTVKDSAALELVSRATGKADTIAMLRPVPRRRTVEAYPDGRIRSSRTEVTDYWAGEELSILLVDGSVAIVRIEPLRVDWRSADGKWLRGAPLPVKRLPLSRKERDAINAQRAEAAAGARNVPAPLRPSYQPLTDFSPTLPVITRDRLTLASAHGQILIRRWPSVALPGNRYLVVNRRGTLDGELALDEKSTVLGFGPRSIYVVTTDEDDVQRVSRHPWP